LELKKFETRLKFQEAGADFIIESMNQLCNVIEEINKRLAKNEKPGGFQIFPRQPYLLYTPGPISTSKEVKLSMMTDMGSREQEYLSIVKNIRFKLCHIASPHAYEMYTSIIVQGCGTFGVEACLGSVIPSNGKLVIIINGTYGERMKKIAQTLKIDCVDITCNENEIPDLDKLEEVLANDKDVTHVGLIHSETTTGILNPLEDFCKLTKKYNKKIIVDAMSRFDFFSKFKLIN
jgi:aspartate aminotransferase-like enzyme